MRRLLPLLFLLAACGSDEPNHKKGSPAVVQDALFTRVQVEARQIRLDLEQYYAMNGEWPESLPKARNDPWGHEYLYEIQDGRAVIWSVGPDGESGTGDDILGG